MTACTSPIRIASQRDQSNLSKGQKAFNALVKRIDASRKELAQWRSVVVTYQQKVARDFAPLMQRVNQDDDKKDALPLLELQLELEHIDTGALGMAPQSGGIFFLKPGWQRMPQHRFP